jgi:hypothetical protein
MAAKKTKAIKKEVLFVSTFKISEGARSVLASLSRDATDIIGREISQAAVLRGLVRLAEQQDDQWIREKLVPTIEEELSAGTTWGRKK